MLAKFTIHSFLHLFICFLFQLGGPFSSNRWSTMGHSWYKEKETCLFLVLISKLTTVLLQDLCKTFVLANECLLFDYCIEL